MSVYPIEQPTPEFALFTLVAVLDRLEQNVRAIRQHSSAFLL
jgi:hypothetical protein